MRAVRVASVLIGCDTRECSTRVETVNGRLRLTVPPVLFGYKISAGGQSVEGDVRGAEESVSAAARVARGSYIELFLTLHPLLAVPEQPTLHVRQAHYYTPTLLHTLAALALPLPLPLPLPPSCSSCLFAAL